MDVFTHISQFWLAIVQILYSILDVLTNTTDRLDSTTFEDTVFHDYLGTVKYAMGTPLYTTFMTAILISIGVAVYKTFMKGVFFVKELLVRI